MADDPQRADEPRRQLGRAAVAEQFAEQYRRRVPEQHGTRRQHHVDEHQIFHVRPRGPAVPRRPGPIHSNPSLLSPAR